MLTQTFIYFVYFLRRFRICFAERINKVSFVSDVVSDDGSLADALSNAEPNVNFGEDQSVLRGFGSAH